MFEARGAGDSRFMTSPVARFAGSIVIGGFDPGAYAPGFMLSPAPQAKLPGFMLACARRTYLYAVACSEAQMNRSLYSIPFSCRN